MEELPERDRRLVEATLRGDGTAFRSLVALHQRLVASVAWRHGVRSHEVEDVVSEVFLKVYASLPRYRPDYPFATWLYRLALNHVLDYGRRARRAPRKAEVPETLPDAAPSAKEGVLAGERAALLREALAAIDPRYRESIGLVYTEGLKVEEAARLLGVPEGTVKTRLLRGREALRKLLVARHPGYFED
jgi:RNA polymerase sigma-70 factor (ECF subfamily)